MGNAALTTLWHAGDCSQKMEGINNAIAFN